MKYIYPLLAFLLVQSVFAQSKLSVIKAASKNVVINDGGVLEKNAWSLSPKARPDIYTADRTRETKWVTFYTDIDSIRVKVKPGSKFDFIVLLNGKDSCYTQIASAITAESLVKNKVATHDTIPFTLTSDNAIMVKGVINGTDTLAMHFDASGYDFKITRDAILKKTKLLSNQPDALAGKTAPNYSNLNKVTKLQIGSLVWQNPPVGSTVLTSNDMDGRIGWNVFEGKQVEINYDKNLLIIHSKLPNNLTGYVKQKLGFSHSFPYAKATFEIEGKQYTGNFLLDNGSNKAIFLDSTWVSKQGFPTDLKLLKTSIMRDPRGVKYETRIVLSPMIKVNGFALTNIPTFLLGSNNPVRFEINYLGNDLLKRFNMILDFQNDYLYLKPNKLMDVQFRDNS